MTRILYLVRHGQAEVARNQKDKTRMLTQAGEAEAHELGKILKAKRIKLDLIVCSTAERALKTAGLIGEQLNMGINNIETQEEVYSENLTAILKRITLLDRHYNSVLIVGHFPTIVELYNYLTEKESIAAMNTAELRSLAFECDWAEIASQSGSPDLFLQPYGL